MARRNWSFAKMIALIRFVFGLLAALCNAKGRPEAEDAVLRQQLIALRHKSQLCARFSNGNRRFLVQLYRWFPSIHDVLMIIRCETVARWYRGGFRRHWHWKLRRDSTSSARPVTANPRWSSSSLRAHVVFRHRSVRTSESERLGACAYWQGFLRPVLS